MAFFKIHLSIGIILCLFILIISTFWFEKQYLLFGIGLIILSMIPFLIKFESKKIEAKEIVLVALLAAIAAVSRVPFAALPSVQPTSFVIIMTGVVFGSETGFMVGMIAAFVSNIFLGQGPWTPWQMFCWGFMGLTAGYLKQKNKKLIAIFGWIWGFLFGWIMNLWFIIGFISPITWKTVFGAYTASFYFDLAHAVSNVFFIKIFSNRWMKILNRIKVKYGLLDSGREM